MCETDRQYDESEIHRLRGELLLRFGKGEADAEASFHKAIKVARRQSAKSWGPRAALKVGTGGRQVGSTQA